MFYSSGYSHRNLLILVVEFDNPLNVFILMCLKGETIKMCDLYSLHVYFIRIFSFSVQPTTEIKVNNSEAAYKQQMNWWSADNLFENRH